MNTHLIAHVTMNDIIHNGLNVHVHAQVGVVTGGCGRVHAQVGVIIAQTSHPQISPVLTSSCLPHLVRWCVFHTLFGVCSGGW